MGGGPGPAPSPASSENSNTDASPDVDTSDDAKASDKKDTKTESNSAWCRKERVSEKECDEWVADQLARRAARKADEQKRRAARKADEQKRLQEQREDEARRRDESHGDDARVASSDRSGSDASVTGPAMLFAASPDVDTSDDATASDKTDTKAQSNAVLCHEDHVSQKDCDEWVAGQLARRAARKADEQKRRAARKADEQKRREDRREDEAHRREARKADEQKHQEEQREHVVQRQDEHHENDLPHAVQSAKETALGGSGFSLSASSNPMGFLNVVGLAAQVSSAVAAAYLAIQHRRPGQAIQEPLLHNCAV